MIIVAIEGECLVEYICSCSFYSKSHFQFLPGPMCIVRQMFSVFCSQILDQKQTSPPYLAVLIPARGALFSCDFLSFMRRHQISCFNTVQLNSF